MEKASDKEIEGRETEVSPERSPIPKLEDIDGIQFGTGARLWIDGGKLRFEGNFSAAADAFFNLHVKPLCDRYIAEHG